MPCLLERAASVRPHAYARGRVRVCVCVCACVGLHEPHHSTTEGDIKRQRTYEPENEITKPPDLTHPNHQQQKSPDTVNTETQQDENMHNIPKEPNETIGEHQITHARDKDRTPTRAKEFTSEYAEPNTMTTPQRDNPDIGSRGTASLTAIEEEKNVRAAAAFRDFMRTTHGFQKTVCP